MLWTPLVIAAICLGVGLAMWRFIDSLLTRLLSLITRKQVTVEGTGFLYIQRLSVELGYMTVVVQHFALNTRLRNPNASRMLTLSAGHVHARLRSRHSHSPTRTSGHSSSAVVSVSERTWFQRLKDFIAVNIWKVVDIVICEMTVTIPCRMLPNSVLTSSITGGIHISGMKQTEVSNWPLKLQFEVNTVSTKLQTFTKQQRVRGEKPKADAELGLSFRVDAAVDPKQGLRTASIEVTVNPIAADVNELALAQVKQMLSSDGKDAKQSVGQSKRSMKDVDWFGSVLAKLPQEISVIVEDSKVKLAVQNGERSLSATINKAYLSASQRSTSPSDELPQLSVTFGLEGLYANGTKSSPLLSLMRLRSSSELLARPGYLAVHCTLDSLHTNYYPPELKFWSSMLRLSDFKEVTGKQVGTRTTDHQEVVKKLLELWEGSMTVAFELSDCSVGAYLQPPEQFCDCPAAKVVLASATTNVELSPLENEPGSTREMKSSIRLENVYAHIANEHGHVGMVGQDNTTVLPLSRKHVWFRPLELGSLSIKAGVNLPTPSDSDSTYHCDVMGECACLCLEYSTELVQTIVAFGFHHTVTSSSQHQTETVSLEHTSQEYIKPVGSVVVNVDIKLDETSLILFGDRPSLDSVYVRQDSLRVAGHWPDLDSLVIKQFGVAITTVQRISPTWLCSPFQALDNPLLGFPSLVITKPNDIVVELPEVKASWTTTVHRSLTERVMQLLNELKSLQDTQSKPMKHKKTSFMFPAVTVKLDKVYAEAQVSSNTNVLAQLHGIHGRAVGLQVTADIQHAIGHFDSHPIFTFSDTHIESRLASDCNETLREVRQHFPQLQLKSNCSYSIHMREARVVFPHQYNFGESVDKVINIFKFLKMLHLPNSTPLDFKLWADLLVKADLIHFELQDDPFEVRLSDIHELMCDEYQQSLERQKLLEGKVMELKKSLGEMTSGAKVDEMYASLQRTDAEMYIARSENCGLRTSLITFTFHSMEIAALADPTLTGLDAVTSHMKKVDPDSELPEGLRFSTLWARMVEGHCGRLEVSLRDYPQLLALADDWSVSGMLMGAEQVAEPQGIRKGLVELSAPWTTAMVTRSMPALKFYYDLDSDFDQLEFAWGSSLEPSLAQVSLAFDLLSKASLDPSPPMPWWDKARLLLHGRLGINAKCSNWHLMASLSPQTVSEQLEFEWSNFKGEWTNGCFQLHGDLGVNVRTASKYDDCQFISFPGFQACFNLQWLCDGDPNNHHSVMPCAPDKVPPTDVQSHDSYKYFRSKNLNLRIVLEVCKDTEKGLSTPSCLLYASTLRLLQKLQVVTYSVTRPVRRGQVFNNSRPKRLTLGRHYKDISVSISYPELKVDYWSSCVKRKGIDCLCGPGCFTGHYNMTLQPCVDRRILRRTQAEWSTVRAHAEWNNVQIDVVEVANAGEEGAAQRENECHHSHCLSLGRLTYDQDEKWKEKEGFKRRLRAEECKGCWSSFNGSVLFDLLETYSKAQILKKDLSSHALSSHVGQTHSLSTAAPGSPSPERAMQRSGSRQSLSSGSVLLDQLIEESSTKFLATADTSEPTGPHLNGPRHCSEDDVTERRWFFELVNSQVVFKGTDTNGAVIVTASTAEVKGCQHKPQYKGGELVAKTSWVARLDNMQYFAPVNRQSVISMDRFHWLPSSIISNVGVSSVGVDESDTSVTSTGSLSFSEMVGSGTAMGGIVTAVVGGDQGDAPQLQRIVSQCDCQIYYANYGGEVDKAWSKVIAPPSSGFTETEGPINTFTLLYPKVEICTNSAQFHMIMDIVTNVLLYVEPKKKETCERVEKMRFRLQLSDVGDPKIHIMQLQDNVRHVLESIHQLERTWYSKTRELEDEINSDRRQSLEQEISDLELELAQTKEQLNAASDDLRILIRCFKESRLYVTPASPAANQVTKIRRQEVWFGEGYWRIMQDDGQLDIADVNVEGFKYSKVTTSDNSWAHRLELESFSAHNLLPHTPYRDALCLHDPVGRGVKVDRAVSLRVYSVGQPPVGGIAVNEHFEINVSPLAVRITHRFYNTMMKFFFPDKSEPASEEEASPALQALKGTGYLESRAKSPSDVTQVASSIPPSQVRTSTAIVSSADVSPPMSPTTKTTRKQKKPQTRPPVMGGDDIEIMKERATNKTCFIYTKIPEIPLCVSYKGEKEKNIEDVEDVRVNLPTLEYHNKTWTWHGLLMEIKKDIQKVLFSQAIKQKLGLSRPDVDSPHEELGKCDGTRDKSKYIFGLKVSAPNPVKASKKLLGKLGRKTGTKEQKGMAASAGHREAEGAFAVESSLEPSDFASMFEELTGCADNPSLHQKSFQSDGCNEQDPTNLSH